MRVLVVGATGGLGTALVALLQDDRRVTRLTAWSRKVEPVTGGAASARIVREEVDLLDEPSIEAAARSLGEVDLAIVATGLLHDGTLESFRS